MVIVRSQRQYRIPWPDGFEGYYYWTNSFFYDTDDERLPQGSRYWLGIASQYITGSVVQEYRVREESPPYSGTIIANFSKFNSPGAYPVEGGYSPFDTVFVRWLVGERRVGFTRLRLPVSGSDQVDGRLHPDLHTYLTTEFNTRMLYAKLTSASGEPLTEFVVDPLVRGWQFRHGTERRGRRVFDPP